MTPEEEKSIAVWGKGLPQTVPLRRIATGDHRDSILSLFCEQLMDLAPAVTVRREDGDAGDLPALQIHPQLRYHGVPSGRELEPFLHALHGGTHAPLSENIRQSLGRIHAPGFLSVFVTPACPHCPITVRQLLPLCAESEWVHLAVIDGALFPEQAEVRGIRSVPTVLLDNQFRWTGSVPLQELTGMMADRDPANLGAASLESMLKEGKASRVAEMMIEAKRIFPAFLDLLVHEKMFVRLGAMVVVEEMAETAPEVALQVVEPLWERFEQANASIRGDILHVIGESGNQDAVPRLRAILAGPSGAEIKEAAEEALARIAAP